MKNIIYFLMAILLIGCGCAFESEDPRYYYSGPGDTREVVKYKRVYIGTCGFSVSPIVEIPDEYAHYRNDVHHFGVRFGKRENGDYASYDRLVTGVPCSACEYYRLKGTVSVLDDKARLLPWGWGNQRPPIEGVKGFVGSHKGFTHNIPAVIDLEDESGVVFDVDEVCEVLVKSGALEPVAMEDL